MPISAESSLAMVPLQIESDLCKACELCIAFCPKHCLALSRTLNSRGYYPVVLQDADACNACALCGQICPDVAIRVYRKIRAKK